MVKSKLYFSHLNRFNLVNSTFSSSSFSTLSSSSSSRRQPRLCPSPSILHLSHNSRMTIQIPHYQAPMYSSISNPSSSDNLTINSDSLDDFLSSTSKPIKKLVLEAPKGVKPFNPNPDNREMLKRISRDFRTDTITVPTEEMIEAMAKASRGDDVYQEDETTNAFQEEIAALTGKEAALFVSSGTLSNQLAIRSWLIQPPYSVLCDERCHIHRYEAGGTAFHSGASCQLVSPKNNHHLTWSQDISPNLIRGNNIHTAPTTLICLENTLNGLIFPQEEIKEIRKQLDRENNEELNGDGEKKNENEKIRLHLDGARLWNVSAETGKSLKELCDPFDSVSLCLSKGLGAPIGSILVGPKKFIQKVRHFRKLFGAGTRQTGPLVAAARTALLNHFHKLSMTHQLAKYLEKEMRRVGIDVLSPAETSMFFIDPTPAGFTSQALLERASQLPNPITLGISRFVIHHQIDKQAILDLVELIREMSQEAKETQEGRKLIEEKKREKENLGLSNNGSSSDGLKKNMYDGGKRI